MLSVPVLPDLKTNQSVSRNTDAKSLLSTRKAQIRPHRQAELSAHLVLAGGRSQQATTRAQAKKRPLGRSKHLRLPAPANVAKSAEHANDTQRLMQARKEERGSSYHGHTSRPWWRPCRDVALILHMTTSPLGGAPVRMTTSSLSALFWLQRHITGTSRPRRMRWC